MEHIPIVDWTEDLEDAAAQILRIPWDFDLWNLGAELERLKPEAILPLYGDMSTTARSISSTMDRHEGCPIITGLVGTAREIRDSVALFRGAGFDAFAVNSYIHGRQMVPVGHIVTFKENEWWHIGKLAGPLPGEFKAKMSWSEEKL